MAENFTLPENFGKSSPKRNLQLPSEFNGLILHCCCAPCSTAVLECLIFNKIRPVLFFFNPNIHPEKEYQKRRDEWLHLADHLKLEAVVGDYDTKSWFDLVKGLEHEPERGRRCDLCFECRLKATAILAEQRGIRYFSTTLATSRWKSKPQVDAAGLRAEGAVEHAKYWDQDWRKEGLVGRRYELVKEIGFYNQLYCGCVYSKISAGCD